MNAISIKNKGPKVPHFVHLISQPIRDRGGHLVVSISSKNTNFVEDITILPPVRLRWIPFSGLIEVKMYPPIRGQGSPLAYPIGPKNTNFVEVVEILLPVKFRCILFSGFREVENVKS